MSMECINNLNLKIRTLTTGQAHKSFTLSQEDVTRHQFLNNSSNEVSKSYYDFARINFYLSGSTTDNYGSGFNIGNDGSG